jgi:hypothetical protein
MESHLLTNGRVGFEVERWTTPEGPTVQIMRVTYSDLQEADRCMRNLQENADSVFDVPVLYVVRSITREGVDVNVRGMFSLIVDKDNKLTCLLNCALQEADDPFVQYSLELTTECDCGVIDIFHRYVEKGTSRTFTRNVLTPHGCFYRKDEVAGVKQTWIIDDVAF